MYSVINRNASILKKIKQEASPKVPKHGDNFNPNKTGLNTNLNLEILSHDLRRHIEGDDQDCDWYFELIEEYEASMKAISVKVLQTFRGKRNPDQSEVKQGQALLMLLSAVD